MINSDIHDLSIQPVQLPSTTSQPQSGTTPAKQHDPGISTIEKKEIIMNFLIGASLEPPSLPPPAEGSGSVASVAGGIASVSDIDSNKIKADIMKAWADNLEQISEQVAALVNSPAFQAMMAIRINGDSTSGSVSGVQSATSANAASANPTAGGNFNIVSAVHQAQVLEKIPPTDQASEADATQALVPLTAVVFIGGALALGGMEATSAAGLSSNPVQGAMEIVDKLSPSLNVLSMEQLIPMINLMVMAPIYYNAWNEATSRLPNKEANNLVATAQKFAQDAIKMVSNPDYVMVTFVNKMEGADHMKPEQKQDMATAMRLILATVALALLYSVETGKAQSGKFWGMEPEELKAILNGDMTPSDAAQTSVQGKLANTLVSLIQAQLSALPSSNRTQIVDAILAYISSNHSVENMLDPTKVLNEVFDSMEFDGNVKNSIEKSAV